MLGEFDIRSKRTFLTKKSWKEYTKWTKDLLEIEYYFESTYFVVHETFSNYWALGEFTKRSQNSIRNSKTFRQ